MIEVEKKDDIAVVTIDNPPMNVLCTELLEELDEELDQLKEEGPKAVVLTGEGRAFVAGADIKEMMAMDADQAKDYCQLGQSVLNKIENFPVPVIAAVNGFALGGGTEISMACDIRIASKAAKFGQPEVNLGVIPGFGGTQRLSRLIGPGKAKELIYTGKIISADEAYEIGLVQNVVEGFELDEEGDKVKNDKGKPIQDNEPVVNTAVEMAEEIAQKGPMAIRNAKKVINKGIDVSLSEGLTLEKKGFSELFSTEDQKEGMEAFIEKRKADFKDK